MEGTIEQVLSGEATWTVQCGDSRELIRQLPDNSIHSCCTDAPYFISFMSAKWDGMKNQAALDPAFWLEVLRVLRPGGHLLCFGFPRTVHRLKTAIEDAGFEIRDEAGWFYGSSMPKGKHNLGKTIDEAKGLKRPVTAEYRFGGNALTSTKVKGGTLGIGVPNSPSGMLTRTAPVSDEAKQWEGWGGLLKIAREPIVVARKPLDGTLMENVLKWGVGAMNIDASRVRRDIANEPDRGEVWLRSGHSKKPRALKIAAPPGIGIQLHPLGNHPPNVLLDELVAGILDEETGEWVSRYYPQFPGIYAPKTSRKERDAGLAHWPELSAGEATEREDGAAGVSAYAGAGRTGGSHNPHKTVKPKAVMEWCVRLVTPIGGIVLDPFLGSGSTLCAAIPMGMRGIGFEWECLSAGAAYDRISYWEQRGTQKPEPVVKPAQVSIFDAIGGIK